MTRLVNRQLRLAHRPTWTATLDDFVLDEVAVPEPGAGQVLVRVDWLAFDPAMRGWMNDGPSYAPPVPLGEVMRGHAVGEVVVSKTDELPVGAVVTGNFGWQTHVVAQPGSHSAALLEHIHAAAVGTPVARPVPEGVPVTAALGVLGTTGLTAYFGMLQLASPRPGDVVLVSGAAGATGSVAGQLARFAGARTIGIAGGAEKVRWLSEVGGFDDVIDYKAEDVRARTHELAPDGVDVFYDNVGGRILEAGIANIAQRGTVVMCGGISSGYSDEAVAYGPTNLSTITVRSADMKGFIVTDFVDRFDEATRRLVDWIRQGRLVWAEDVHEGGVEDAVDTMNRLFDGKNLGKQLLRLQHK
ncbi:NADP-dependent oxidoreductase [Streptosporangium sp. NPDC002544]|uniref:NADP-dependent oxidoreductase n=1 Tax=Streptosporangium sp. NPDC002544 TaxID=3154538 RepID=UPI00332FB928